MKTFWKVLVIKVIGLFSIRGISVFVKCYIIDRFYKA